MCDDHNNITSSSSIEEGRRIRNRIDACISSLITLIDENEHINPETIFTPQESFNNKLKHKISNDTVFDPSIKIPITKTLKPTINRYYLLNIDTLNIQGFNNSAK
jgi:hypothetical protein